MGQEQNKVDTGGPAFAQTPENMVAVGDQIRFGSQYNGTPDPGMTLLDYFAAKAMQAFIQVVFVKCESVKWDQAATASYDAASAMIAEKRRLEVYSHQKSEIAPDAKTLAALQAAEKALTHDVPQSCWSTGPNNGDASDHLCPGCESLRQIRAAIAKEGAK